MTSKKEGGVSRYKLEKIAVEALDNSLRLHFDAIFLFWAESYASSFQLAVLALEEFAKAQWVEHYVYTSITNEGFPDERFEQEWLQLLYRHPEKQWSFLAREIFDFSPKFAEFVRENKLEEKKQNATYVGLSRSKGKVDTSSRVSTPKRIKAKDPLQIISILNGEYKHIIKNIDFYEMHYGLAGMDELFDKVTIELVQEWPYSSGLKSRKWRKVWHETRPTNN
ncbi:MAG: AbiV family abortive infection protein [Proteobacteria bacterium]|nr:AbiV family abortive infection protein [Pseudomonadota bacterium]MDA0927009.1 AbiV family abortive infection protein [Pseudomonadota bacterium]